MMMVVWTLGMCECTNCRFTRQVFHPEYRVQLRLR